MHSNWAVALSRFEDLNILTWCLHINRVKVFTSSLTGHRPNISHYGYWTVVKTSIATGCSRNRYYVFIEKFWDLVSWSGYKHGILLACMLQSYHWLAHQKVFVNIYISLVLIRVCPTITALIVMKCWCRLVTVVFTPSLVLQHIYQTDADKNNLLL